MLTPINTRLTKREVEYILEHSGAKLILVDHEYTHLVEGASATIIICKDTGQFGDPYEDFLAKGRQHSNEKGWPGLDMELDENVGATLCYTYVIVVVFIWWYILISHYSSGTTGRVSYTNLHGPTMLNIL